MRPYVFTAIAATVITAATMHPVMPGATPSSVMLADEELVYEVSWSMFKLGKIRVKLFPARSDGSVYSSVAYTDSYDLPFVDFHAISTSEMDSTLFSEGSSLFEKRDTNWFRQVYTFDPATRVYVTENAYVKDVRSEPQVQPKCDTLRLPYTRFQDGTSILYFARARVHAQQAVAVPTLVRGKAGRTNFYFPGMRTRESIDAVSYPIRVIEFEGKAEFEGIFGLTGDFTGWFSDDEAAVPIKAKLKVLLGSVWLELKEWKRGNWVPRKPTNKLHCKFLPQRERIPSTMFGEMFEYSR
jgi:hypothetical protein